MSRCYCGLIVFFSVVMGLAGSAAAVQPCEQLLPDTTKSFLSAPDVDELRARLSSTDLGRLVDDPHMQPFVEDLRKQLDQKLSQTGVRLNISWQDVEGVYGGEVCVATIQPGGDPSAHAVALIVDVTDHLDEARALLEKVNRNLAAKGARRTTENIRGVEVAAFALPPKEEGLRVDNAYYFIHQEQLVATDHKQVAADILARFGQSSTDTLAQLPTFSQIMQRCQQSAGDLQPHIRWFIEPFGYTEVVRAAAGGRKRRGTDLLKVLSNQGFTAIQGMGGVITFSVDDLQLVHRTLIYAPATAKDGKSKYQLAARMLDFPNIAQQGAFEPQPWVPSDVATYLTFQWRMQQAFEHSKSLVNELADAGEDDIFEDVLDGIKRDPLGPEVDLRQDLVAHLGQRATLISDYKLPITTESERLLLAVEVQNVAAITKTVNKAMGREPDASPIEFGDVVIWEILPVEGEEVPKLNIDGPGFGAPFGQPPAAEEEDEGPALPNSAITVAAGHLIIASHVDFVKEVLEQLQPEKRLTQTEDFQRVQQALRELGLDEASFFYFSRTDEAHRPTYELLREGKMPESETLFAKTLNRFLGPEEEGALRSQEIDASKLPPYEQVQGYFGPAGFYVTTNEQGWFIAGCLLSRKQAAQ